MCFKKYLLVLLAGVLLQSCKKDRCQDIRFEVSGASTTISAIDFRLASSGSSYEDPDVFRSITDVAIPYSETVGICEDEFDYNLRCYTSDTTLLLTLKIYQDGVLLDEKTGSPYGFLELAGGSTD